MTIPILCTNKSMYLEHTINTQRKRLETYRPKCSQRYLQGVRLSYNYFLLMLFCISSILHCYPEPSRILVLTWQPWKPGFISHTLRKINHLMVIRDNCQKVTETAQRGETEPASLQARTPKSWRHLHAAQPGDKPLGFVFKKNKILRSGVGCAGKLEEGSQKMQTSGDER